MGCELYAELSARGIQTPCDGCPLYLSPRLHPLTSWAVALYWQAFGDPVAQERYRVADVRLPAWKAAYVFGVWEIYATIRAEAQLRRQPVTDAPEGGVQGVNTELPSWWLEQRGDDGPRTA